MRIVLQGGGNNVYKIINDLDFMNQRVAYVSVASENDLKLNVRVKSEFGVLVSHFNDKFEANIFLVETSNFDDMFNADCIIISGGDTEHLIKMLKKYDFKKKLIKSSVSTIIGISAGAIALAKWGLGKNSDGVDQMYEGLGIAEDIEQVVPHSNNRKKEEYPDALHLKEYEFAII